MIVSLLTAAGLSQRLARIAAPVIGIALLIALVWALWARGNGFKEDLQVAKADLREANAELALLRTDAELKEIAAGERQADTAAIAEAEKELIDAIQQIPDSHPDAVRVHLGCERLRRSGRAEIDLPESCRLDGGAEARSAP
jgi:hypothetical protein